jgi:hypothetical protein
VTADVYGPATPALRAIAEVWRGIDWFAPTGTDESAAAALVQAHVARAHRASRLFPARVRIRHELGDRGRFISLWDVATNEPASSWKWTRLRRLSADHARAHRWSQRELLRVPEQADLPVRREGYADGPLVVMFSFPAPEPTQLYTAPFSASAHAYLRAAQQDAVAAAAWQLAERSADTTSNPFVPLLECYRAGFYPFSLAGEEVCLFRFTADAHALPKAIAQSR